MRCGAARLRRARTASPPGCFVPAVFGASAVFGAYLRLELLNARLGLLDGLRVVGTAEATVAGDDDKADRRGRAGLEERDVKALGREALQQAAEDALEGLREGARAEDSLLRTPHLRSRHKLHRRGDLLSVLGRDDAVAQLADGRTHHHLRRARGLGRRRRHLGDSRAGRKRRLKGGSRAAEQQRHSGKHDCLHASRG